MLSPKFCLSVGIAGGVVAALCCFTPLLVVVLGWLGLSAWLGGLDSILLPALGVFVALATYGYYAGQRPAVVALDDSEPPTE